jgi:membrane protein
VPAPMHRAAHSFPTYWAMARETVTAWIADFAPSMGAAIAYYTAFSIAPLLVIVISVAGIFYGTDAASGYLYAQLADLLGDQGAQVVRDMVDRAGTTEEGVIAPIISVALLLIGATTVFAELQGDLDRIWKAPAAKKSTGLWALLRSRILSLGMVVSIGFLMLVSLVFSAALAALGKWWGGLFADFAWLLRMLDITVSLGMISVMFALMYKILPRVKISWHDVWIGSIATALLFAVGKFLVGLYIGRSQVASSFGAAGSLVVVLVWVYYSAQIFLLGAEFTWVYAHRLGSRRDEAQAATAKESLQTTPPSPGQPGN